MSVGPEAVFGIDLVSGQERWSVPRAPGPSGPPALAFVGGQTVVLYTEGSGEEESVVRARDLEERQDIWSSPVSLEAPSRTGVTVVDLRAFVGDERGTVYAVDLPAGEVAWTFETGGSLGTSLAVAMGMLYAVVEGGERGGPTSLVALDAETGERRWTFEPEVASPVASGVAVGKGSAYVGFSDRVIRSVDAETGMERWGGRANALFSPAGVAAVADGDVVAVDVAGQVYRLDGASGARLWDHALNDLVVRSSPAVVGDHVLVGLNGGRLVALDLDTGDLVWRSAATPGLVGPVGVSDEVVVAVKGGGEGGLVAFEHDPEGRLIRVPSPTVLDPGGLLGAYVMALVVVVVIVYVPSRILARRIGLPELPGGPEDEGADDPQAEP